MLIERQNQTTQPGQSSQRHHAGFTLVELMVTIAVIAILAVAAVPSMTAMINNGRISSQSEELLSSIQLARSEAIRRNARVTLCAGSSGACSGSTSWGQFTVFGADNTAAVAGADDVIRDTTLGGGVQVTGPTAPIVFRPSGMIDTSQQLEASMDDLRRCIVVGISGAVSLTKSAC